MCTQEETRAIVKAENPLWVKVLVGISLALITTMSGGILSISNSSEQNIETARNEQEKQLNDVVTQIALLNSDTNYSFKLLQYQLNSIDKTSKEKCAELTNKVDKLEAKVNDLHSEAP